MHLPIDVLNLVYFIRETNSYSCHGAPGVSNTAGAALWTLDYTLFASQIGISRVHFHEGIGYKYNLVCSFTLAYYAVQDHNGQFSHVRSNLRL